jgi:very-short-patch-repair endonuclease
MKKICAICGNEFEHKGNRNYCDNCKLLPCSYCGKMFKPSDYQRKQAIGHNNIYCSRECINKGMPKTHKEVMINKYGSEHYYNIEKYKETMNKKYGVDFAMQSKEIHDRFKETMNKRYGVNYSGQSEILLKKSMETYKERTGYLITFKNPEVINKSNKTKLKRYGNCHFTNIDKRNKTNMYKYNRLNTTQKGLSDFTYNIITDKDRFKNFVLQIPESERTIAEISKRLNLCESQTAIWFYHRYNLDEEVKLHRNRSIAENNIIDYLKSIGIKDDDMIQNTRKIISPLEIDVYIPSKKVAIEYNGIWYHSINHIEDKNYHYNKSKMCEDKGIRLIHIWEHEWNNERQRPILENIIKSALGMISNRIYARKLDIEVRESKDMIDFFNTNNIQGFRGGKFAICLVDKQTREVYMSYIMGHPFFSKGKYQWEVIRGATKLNTTVIGGASKIFKYFISNYKPDNCLYYIDYNYFNGNSLKSMPNMKFIKSQISFKNYFVRENVVRNRNPMHHKDIKKLEEKGLVIPFYNAGTKVYLWEKS